MRILVNIFVINFCFLRALERYYSSKQFCAFEIYIEIKMPKIYLWSLRVNGVHELD
jgi:hypothetical protein